MIVEAVGISAGTLNSDRKWLAKAIEGAMAAAVTKARAEGISDPVETKARMLAAREAVLAEVGLRPNKFEQPAQPRSFWDRMWFRD